MQLGAQQYVCIRSQAAQHCMGTHLFCLGEQANQIVALAKFPDSCSVMEKSIVDRDGPTCVEAQPKVNEL